jgi:phosphoglycerate dehydrogenase-like enzyme
VRVVVCRRDEVHAHIADADVAVPLMTRLDAAIIAAGTRLQLVLQFGVGLEGVDQDACSRQGVVLARIPSEQTGNAASTAEMAVYLLLAALRRHGQLAASLASQTLGAPMGRQLKGMRVLIVGWGNIAREVAVRLAPFGVRLSAVRRSRWDTYPSADDVTISSDSFGLDDGAGANTLLDSRCQPGATRPIRSGGGEDSASALLLGRGIASTDMVAMLGAADAVVLACNQTSENRGMVDDDFLAAMVPGAVLVNVARGGLFDKDAIFRALESGRLGYLASDVAWVEPVDPNDPLVRNPNAYFTPHVGGVTDVSYDCMGAIVAEAAKNVLRGQAPGSDVTVVNHEAAAAARSAKTHP